MCQFMSTNLFPGLVEDLNKFTGEVRILVVGIAGYSADFAVRPIGGALTLAARRKWCVTSRQRATLLTMWVHNQADGESGLWTPLAKKALKSIGGSFVIRNNLLTG